MYREDFPQVKDSLVYLDNAATTFKPRSVIDAVANYYQRDNASPRRGLYSQSVNATCLLEQARANIADFIGADADEVIFTSGATMALNILALSLARDHESVAISINEHHSNLLPWRKNFKNVHYFTSKDIERVDIISYSPYSNVFGEMSQDFKTAIVNRSALKVIDATQAIAHQRIDFHNSGADFMVFSGHKIYGPMGIGVLCGRRELLTKLKPAFWGGEMVDNVSSDFEELAETPARFEAGTVNVAGAIGLSTAINYLRAHDFDALNAYERKLSAILHNELRNLDDIEFAKRDGYEPISTINCFNVQGIHPHDLAQLLADDNIALRAGYHCAQLALDNINFGPAARASISFYNTESDIAKLLKGIKSAKRILNV